MTHATDPGHLAPFGLRRGPFQPTADPDFFFPDSLSAHALDRILATLRAGRGVCVLTGETGTGKTTVLRRILVELGASGGLLPILTNAPLGLEELISLLGASPSAQTACQDEQLAEITRRLRELADAGRPVVLAIDEAQALDEDMLGHVTALLGSAAGPDALGSLVLVGQPALASRLERWAEQGLEIAVRCSLGPLRPQEVGPYIVHRLREAGGENAELFSPQAVGRIGRLSGGAPRFVNLLCRESLAAAARQGARRVELDTVNGVAEELGFTVFPPLPRPPGIEGGASRRAMSRRHVLWASMGVVAVALLFLFPYAIRGIRPGRQPVSPLATARPDMPAQVTDAFPDVPSSGALKSPQEPAGEEPGPTVGSGVEAPNPDTRVAGPPSAGRPSGPGDVARPSTQPRGGTGDERAARAARVAPSPASSVPSDRDKGQTLLLRVETRDVAGVLALLAAGESPDTRDRAGFTPLMLAAIHGEPAIRDALLRRGAAVNARNHAGQTALMLAAINNNLAMAKKLLDRDADVNARTAAGWTALMYAAWEGHPEIARLLLARGADASLKDQQGWTAQRYAAWRVSPPAAAESGGAVTGINQVEASRPASQGHAAVLELLTDPGRQR